MRTKNLQKIRQLLLLVVALVVGVLGARAYDYTGYDYTNEFTSSTLSGGSIISGGNGGMAAFARGTGGDYCLGINASGSGARHNGFAFASAVPFSLKVKVEFDWRPTTFGGAAGTEGRIAFRKGTGAADELFAVYQLQGQTGIGVAVGTGSTASALIANVPLANKRFTTVDVVYGNWYHVAVEVDMVKDSLSFSITGIDSTSFSFAGKLSYPTGTTFFNKSASIANVYFYGTRTSPTNLSWATQIDNIGVKKLDATYPRITAINVTGPSTAGVGGKVKAVSSVLPAGAPNWVTWTSAQGLVTLTPNAHGDTCTVAGVAEGLDTILVTSADGSNIVKRHPIEVLPVLVNSITIGGRDLIRTFYTNNPTGEVLKLTGVAGPDSANNRTFTWSSSKTAIATVADTSNGVYKYAAVSLVGGFGLDSIKATANDKGKFMSAYAFMVDSMKLRDKHYNYVGYGYVDLFNNGEDFLNGSMLTSSAYSYNGGYSYDAVNKWIKYSLSNGSLGRRQYYQLKKPANFSQKATVEFDWYAANFTGSAVNESAAELQITFVDADLKDIFTVYHSIGVPTSFGVVAGKLNVDETKAGKSFNSSDANAYWASRSGAVTIATNTLQGKIVAANLAAWYHIKAEINVGTKKINVAITLKEDGSAVDAFTLDLPADFVMAEGISMVLSNCAGTGSGATFEDRMDNLGIKIGDVLTPGKKVSSIKVSQATDIKKVIVNKTLQLRANVLPVDAEKKALTWSSENETYATVDEYGVVKGYEAGANKVVGIIATATDGSNVADTFKVTVIRQPITGIALSGTRTYYVTDGSPVTSVIKAVITPANAYNKAVTWSGKNLTLGAVSVKGDSVYQTITVNTVGNDTIVVVANDGEGGKGTYPIKVLPNPYPNYEYVELFNDASALNGNIYSIQGNQMSIDLRSADDLDDRVLLYNASNSNARACRFCFGLAAQVNYTRKVLVEFDWLPAKATGEEGHFSFMSLTNETKDKVDLDAKDVFGLYNTTDTAGFGVTTGPVARSGTDGYSYTGVRLGTAVDPLYRQWVPAKLNRWYHVRVELNVDTTSDASARMEQHANFMFTSGTDTFHVVLPLPEGTPNKIGQIVGVGRNSSHYWNSAIDNLGIKVLDKDADVVAATGIDVTPTSTAIPVGEFPVEVVAAIKPWSVSNHTISWKVSNDAKARIEVAEGYPTWRANVYGKAIGDVYAIATAHNGVKDSVKLEVKIIDLDSFRISGPAQVSVGRTISMVTGEVWPKNAGYQRLRWESSNPAIASVDEFTGVVTGHNAGPNGLDSVIITAKPFDGGAAAPLTHKLKVVFTKLTKIDMWGAKRIFYTTTPASESRFAVGRRFTPATASDTLLTWSSTDESILTVTDAGVVTLVGGFGKAAVKVVNAQSGTEGYYYIEVAQASPYVAFADFEDGVAKLGSNVITFAASASAAPAIGSIQGTTAIRNSGGGSGARAGEAVFTSPLTGEGKVLNLKFDWYNQVNSSPRGTVQLSLRNSQSINVISWAVVKEKVDSAMRYFTEPGVYSAAAMTSGGFLAKANKYNTWYTIDVNIDSVRRLCSFTVTERDRPENTHTVRGIELDPALQTVDVKQLQLYGPRPQNDAGTGNGSNTDYIMGIDNLSYRTLIVTYADVTLDPAGGAFADETTDNKVFSVEINTSFDDRIPSVSRTGYTFDGWYYSDGTTKYATTDVVSVNTTLTAKWSINHYTVTFAGDSINIPSQSVAYGSKPSRPADPTRSDCYNFKGWYQSETSSTPFSFNTEITGDVTAYAQWEVDEECENEPTGVAGDRWPNLQVYPNPTTSNFVVVSGLEGNETISVLDMSGRVMLVRNATGASETIVVGQLPQGTYVVKLAKDGNVKVVKIVVSGTK